MRAAAIILSALGLAALVGGASFGVARLVFKPAPVVGPDGAWREIDWPYLRDGWPSGRAFRCDERHCGAEVLLSARVKVGFCDCTKGVSDDDDLDRVGDADLVTADYAPEGPGAPKRFSGMDGRQRVYRSGGSTPAILVVAGGRNCNAFVGMATSQRPFTPAAVEAVTRFLEAPAMARWIADRQGG